MTTLPVLRGTAVGLRPLEPDDLDTLYAWENDLSAWATSGLAAPFSRQLLSDYLTNYDTDIFRTRQLRLMVCLLGDGTPVGMVDLFNLDPLNGRAEVGLFVAPDYRGGGLGGDALDIAATYARDHLGLRQLYAHVAADNAASLALFTSAGYQRAGLLRKWLRHGGDYRDAALLQRVF